MADQILPDLQGEALVQALRERYTPARTLSYHQAREEMFARLDNEGGRVTLFYTGEQYTTSGIPSEREVNTEHTWPQSRFEDARGRNRMKADLHHLFPTPASVNNRRGNNAFAEIPDEQTRYWYRSSLARRDLPTQSERDGYSEATDELFEPREVDKGNAARALFYFYTIYGGEHVDRDWFQPQVETLLHWHQQDPADAKETERTRKIAVLQGNLNPFVLDPELAGRVFGHGLPDSPPAPGAPGQPLAERIRPSVVRPENAPRVAPGNAAPAPPPMGARLRIGAWNVENLGTRGADSNAEDQDPDALAEYIVNSKVSVLSVEEIHDDDQTSSNTPGHAPWQNRILDRCMAKIEELTGQRWKYALTPPGPDNTRQQLTGVAWNTESVSLLERTLLEVTGGEIQGATAWTRRPEAFQFSTGQGLTDFVLIPLHMKSNSGGPRTGRAVRVEEARQLKAALPGLRTALHDEKDIVLLGDTNMLGGEDTAAANWGAEFRDLNSAEEFTYIKPHGHDPLPPFDRIFVPVDQPEFSLSRQERHGPYGDTLEARRLWQREHLDERSDHLLVWTELQVLPDDD